MMFGTRFAVTDVPARALAPAAAIALALSSTALSAAAAVTTGTPASSTATLRSTDETPALATVGTVEVSKLAIVPVDPAAGKPNPTAHESLQNALAHARVVTPRHGGMPMTAYLRSRRIDPSRVVAADLEAGGKVTLYYEGQAG